MKCFSSPRLYAYKQSIQSKASKAKHPKQSIQSKYVTHKLFHEGYPNGSNYGVY